MRSRISRRRKWLHSLSSACKNASCASGESNRVTCDELSSALADPSPSANLHHAPCAANWSHGRNRNSGFLTASAKSVANWAINSRTRLCTSLVGRPVCRNHSRMARPYASTNALQVVSERARSSREAVTSGGASVTHDSEEESNGGLLRVQLRLAYTCRHSTGATCDASAGRNRAEPDEDQRDD